jgi:branched-chain amino acid transport system ATP-binding protein
VREERGVRQKALGLLEYVGLKGYDKELSKNLAYGLQRRLEVARALATEPELLFLDEPAAGMNPQESVELMNLIHFIRERFNLTILLIEHQMRVVMGICEQISVMDFGELIAQGTPREIQSNQKVIEAYLGPDVTSLTKKYQIRKMQRHDAKS